MIICKTCGHMDVAHRFFQGVERWACDACHCSLFVAEPTSTEWERAIRDRFAWHTPDDLWEQKLGPLVRAAYAAGANETRQAYVDQHGCQCDPPGSGEEWCVGSCWLRIDVERERHRGNTLEQRNRDLVREVDLERANANHWHVSWRESVMERKVPFASADVPENVRDAMITPLLTHHLVPSSTFDLLCYCGAYWTGDHDEILQAWACHVAAALIGPYGLEPTDDLSKINPVIARDNAAIWLTTARELEQIREERDTQIRAITTRLNSVEKALFDLVTAVCIQHIEEEYGQTRARERRIQEAVKAALPYLPADPA